MKSDVSHAIEKEQYIASSMPLNELQFKWAHIS